MVNEPTTATVTVSLLGRMSIPAPGMSGQKAAVVIDQARMGGLTVKRRGGAAVRKLSASERSGLLLTMQKKNNVKLNDWREFENEKRSGKKVKSFVRRNVVRVSHNEESVSNDPPRQSQCKMKGKRSVVARKGRGDVRNVGRSGWKIKKAEASPEQMAPVQGEWIALNQNLTPVPRLAPNRRRSQTNWEQDLAPAATPSLTPAVKTSHPRRIEQRLRRRMLGTLRTTNGAVTRKLQSLKGKIESARKGLNRTESYRKRNGPSSVVTIGIDWILEGLVREGVLDRMGELPTELVFYFVSGRWKQL
jgi:hypothetical protein